MNPQTRREMNNMKMQFVSIKNDTAIISVGGVYNFCRVPAVKAEIALAQQNGCTKVLVDFAKTASIDSAAIGYLTELLKSVGEDHFAAKNARGKVLTALEIGNLDTQWIK